MKVYDKRIKHEAFIGTVIGKVKIISFDKVETSKDRHVYFYNYLCVCGTIESAPKYSLLASKRKNKNTYCCSICRKNKVSEWAKTAKVKYENPLDAKCSTLFSNYRTRSKTKKLEFSLTFDYFKELVTNNCHYCNLAPNKCRKDRAKSRMGISRIYFNGIDRLDSSQGYTIENTVSCCEDCNKAKRNLSYTQFLNLIKRIYEFKIKNKL